MNFHPDLAPEMRNSSPEKNHDLLAQAMLVGRDPAGEQDWVERYAERFRKLYETDEDFRELVNSDLTDGILTRIQQRLDQHPLDKAA